jgi:hypothetical protein
MRIAANVALCVVTAAVSVSAQTVSRNDCPYDPARHRDERVIRAEASRFAELIAPTGKRRAVSPPSNAFPEERNFIDVELYAAMKKAGISPAPLSSDAEFLRRITLDLGGRIPTTAEVRAFLQDTTGDKRQRAIDRLLASDEFNDRWALWFGDLVQNTLVASGVGRGTGDGRSPFHRWIRASIEARKPYDAMVREMVSSAGRQTQIGQVNYLVRQKQENGPPQDTFDNLATQSGAQFLGMPLMCVSCHDGAGHLEAVNMGLSRTKRRQFWGMAAFFARTTIRFQGGDFNVAPITGGGAYRLGTVHGNKSARTPGEGQPDTAEPAYLHGGGKPEAGEDWRVAYGRMLTADRQFARAAVNYLWKQMFGLGIVEPVDGFDLARLSPPAGITPQPSHPALLEQLTDHFITNGYDLRSLLRLMATSSAYQLSAQYSAEAWNETWTSYFPRRYPRRLMAEVMLDAIHQATGRPFEVDIADYRRITSAVAAPDPYAILFSRYTAFAQFLGDFGQGNRDTMPRTNAPSLVQTLILVNDPFVLRGTKRTENTFVGALLRETRDPDQIIERLYVASLSRLPSPSETSIAREYLAAGNLDERTEDLQYVLLNTLEFSFN